MTATQKLRVLIADDELLARQRLEDLLAKKNEVDLIGMAVNGQEAVEAIRSLAPDLVFLDVQMPGLTGMEVVREIGCCVDGGGLIAQITLPYHTAADLRTTAVADQEA